MHKALARGKLRLHTLILHAQQNLSIYSTIDREDPLVLLIRSKKSLWILADAQRSTKMRRQESETDLERSIGPSEALFDNVFEVHSLITVLSVDEV